MDIEALSDVDLQRKLDEGAKVEDMLKHPGWEIATEAMNRQIRVWEKQLRKLNPLDPEQQVKMVEIQQRLFLADDFLPNTINAIRQNGFNAFLEVKDRDEQMPNMS